MQSLAKCLIVKLESLKPYLVALFIQLAYAGNALFSKAAVSHGINPFVFVAYRQAFATLALAPFAFFLERNREPLSVSILCKIFLVSFCGISIFLNMFYIAMSNTSATFASAATNTIPAITFILAVLFRMENVSIWNMHGVAKIVGTVISISGAIIFGFLKGPQVKFINWYPEYVHNLQDPTISTILKGPFLMILANATYALWLILQGPLMKEYPAKLSLTTIQCFFSSLQTAILAIIMDTNISQWKLQWNLQFLSLAYCGIIVTGMTFWLQIWTVQQKGPVFTASFTPLALIITALFATFIWKEALYWGRVGGALLLVVGLFTVLWGKHKEEKERLNNVFTTQRIKEDDILQCITHQ